jgi:serine protease Do
MPSVRTGRPGNRRAGRMLRLVTTTSRSSNPGHRYTPVGREVPGTLVRQGRALTLTVTIGRIEEPTPQATATPTAGSPLGLSLQSLTPALAREFGLHESRGVLVRGVEDDSRAAHAGLQPGDVVVEVDQHPVATASQVGRLAATHPSSTPLLLLVHRNGANLYVAITG